jgi:hypothetical protein
MAEEKVLKTNQQGLFVGTVKITSTEPGKPAEIELDATCDAEGLGEILGMAARGHIQHIPAASREVEFRRLISAFIFSAAQRDPVKVLEGSTELVPQAPSSEARQ